MTDGVDYIFVEKESSELYSVKILKGRWKSIIYTYGKVSIIENLDEGTATLKFDYRIEDAGEKNKKEDLIESVKFKQFIGDILTTILSNSEAQIGNKKSGRTTKNNTKEADI